MRGSRCARFEVRTVVGREDMHNTLFFDMLQGGCIVGMQDHITIYLLTAFEIDYDSLGWGKYNI